MSSILTPKQIELARHALGLPNKGNRSYRNRYVSPKTGDDYFSWLDMANVGLARSYGHITREHLEASTVYFELTLKGASLVLKPKEKLCQEDFPGQVNNN